MATRANISKEVNPHVLCHTLSTPLLENEVNIKYIQSLLDDSSIITSQI
ncbi:tyrosine-type recombinase/integrase [Mucilaginibacter sp.]